MNFKKPSEEQLKELIPAGTFLLGYRGSVAAGTWEPPEAGFSTDDIDLMGVAIGPIDHYFGLSPFCGKRSTFERFIGEYDVVTYELRKFVSLLCNCNPNVLALLWLEPEMYLKMDEIGALLVENRRLFATKRIYNAFVGYAKGQLHKTTHDSTLGYMGTKRKALVERFGFDPKAAAHCIRLLRMGVEFLEQGRLNVYRHDKDQLLDIKHGEWSLGLVKLEADRLLIHAEDALRKCDLPPGPDMAAVDKLLVSMITDATRLINAD